MIHEEICTHEVCKLAKEKGFPQHPKDNDRCQIYCWDGLRHIHSLDIWEVWFYDEYHHDNLYAAPSQSLLQRWLREEKEVFVEVYTRPHFATTHTKTFYVWNIQYYDCKQAYRIFQAPQDTFYTYEEALEDALKYALENLV